MKVLLKPGSPVSDDGRGLKLLAPVHILVGALGSPVSDDGRGLKLQQGIFGVALHVVRPSVMTGVD